MAFLIGSIIERDSEGSVDKDGKVSRSHTERFRCESDSPIGTATAGVMLGYRPGQPHPEDPLTNLKSVKIKELNHRNPWRFDVTVTYSNNVPDQSEIEDDNPFNTPAKVRWEDGDQEIAITQDRDGNAILLPNKRPFNPPVKMLIPAGRLVVNKNERRLDVDPGLSYRKHVNSNTYAGKDEGTLLLLSISSERDSKNGVIFYPTEYVFVWNPQGWNEEILSQDTHELINDEWRPILDEKKNPLTDPVPIDEDGARIPAENLPQMAHYQKINKYPEANFEALRLPV